MDGVEIPPTTAAHHLVVSPPMELATTTRRPQGVALEEQVRMGSAGQGLEHVLRMNVVLSLVSGMFPRAEFLPFLPIYLKGQGLHRSQFLPILLNLLC